MPQARGVAVDGTVGSCFDNAAEAFFSTLEHEVLSRHHFPTNAQAREVVTTSRIAATRRLREDHGHPPGGRIKEAFTFSGEAQPRPRSGSAVRPRRRTRLPHNRRGRCHPARRRISASSPSPMGPSASAALCQVFRSNAAPCRAIASLRAATQARSPSLYEMA